MSITTAPPIVRQGASFAAIGLVSTGAYALLYLVLRTGLGAEVSNALALLVTAIGNTAANRRLTFGARDRDGLARDHAGGLIAFGAALAITTIAVLVLHTATATAPRAVELAVLIVANGLATVVRFVMLRAWITRGRPPSRTSLVLRKAVP
jgi:putative flippase GtrA